jgi:3-deoxy-D-manno-octulosonic-acid transferase
MLLRLVLFCNTLIAAGLIFFLPVLLPLITARAKRRHTFLQRMGWRQPYVRQPSDRGCHAPRIWVHALSVGEVMAAQPMVNRLKRLNPDAGMFLTFSTLTGFQTARRLFPDHTVHLAYFPYDTIWSVRRVADKIAPTHVIITETDLWPTFIWEMNRRKIPVYLVNLRLSERTVKGYNRFKRLVRSVYHGLDHVCVQTPKEKIYLEALGVAPERISISGNLKFDGLAVGPDSNSETGWRKRLSLSPEQRLIVAGSTHEGEEIVICNALKPALLKSSGGLSLIVAPRDPNRGLAVQTECRRIGLQAQRLSRLEKRNTSIFPQVVVVDQLGVLKGLYGLAAVTFVGGSLVPQGGHNPLEPAHWAKPVLFGPDMRDFDGVAHYLLNGGGAVQIHSGPHLRSVAEALLGNPQQALAMGQNALKVIRNHQGAVERTLFSLKLDQPLTCTDGVAPAPLRGW